MNYVFAGHDQREIDSYRIFYHTCYKHSRDPSNLVIHPLVQSVLRNTGVYKRPPDEKASTEFSLTRFLVPYLMGYKGFSLFLDGADMILTGPVENIFDYADPKYALLCVKHPPYTPKLSVKMDGQTQLALPRKNWSSVMLFNCEHPKNRDLSDKLNSNLPPSYFHRMEWLNDEDIGELPVDFNFLCEEYLSKEEFEKKYGRPGLLLHHTNGCPIFPERVNDEYAELFFDNWKEISGGISHKHERLRNRMC